MGDAMDFFSEVAQKIVVAIAMFCLTTIVSFFIGRWWGAYRARSQWENKHFLGQLNVSFNILQDNKLRIRTLFEKPVEEIFANSILCKNVLEAAKSTTPENPILPLPAKDSWYYLNFVLNSVAEKFSSGFAKLEAGQQVASTYFYLFLTCEVVSEDRLKKIRAMLVRKDVLDNFPYMESLPTLEKNYHVDRIKTLRVAAQMLKTNPQAFIPMEIVT